MNQRELRYSKDHEWISTEGAIGKIGITGFAQEQLGDVVFVELPEVGRDLEQGAQPDLVNKDPEAAWLIEIELKDPNEMSSLLDSEEYDELVK